MWFTKFMRGFIRHLRNDCGYRVLPYIDDFLVAAAPPGRAATEKDAATGRTVVGNLFDQLGLVRKVGKGCWEGSRSIDHLGMHVDTMRMRVFVSDAKVERVRRLSKKVLLLAQRNRRLVNRDLLEHFCGVCVALTLALRLARFYTRSIYFDLAGAGLEERGQSPQRRRAPRATRLAFLAVPHERGRARAATVSPAASTALGFRRRQLGRHAWTQLPSRIPGFVGGSRFLERQGPRGVDHPEGAASSPTSPLPILLRLRLKPPHKTASGARGQPSRGAHPQRHGIR